MNMEEFIKYCKEGNPISSEDKELSPLLYECSQNAIKITIFTVYCEFFIQCNT